jgi:hypothetical protein
MNNLSTGKEIDLTEIWGEDVDWIHLAQHRAQWRALVNMILDLLVP